jgi:hypothetical protein
LRLVAQYADACNIFDMGPDKVKAKYDVIRQHCEDVGRPYDEIEKTVLTSVDFDKQSDDALVERCGKLADVGTQHIIMSVKQVSRSGSLDRIPGLLKQLT